MQNTWLKAISPKITKTLILFFPSPSLSLSLSSGPLSLNPYSFSLSLISPSPPSLSLAVAEVLPLKTPESNTPKYSLDFAEDDAEKYARAQPRPLWCTLSLSLFHQKQRTKFFVAQWSLSLSLYTTDTHTSSREQDFWIFHGVVIWLYVVHCSIPRPSEYKNSEFICHADCDDG